MSDAFNPYVVGADCGGTKTILCAQSLATGASRRQKFGTLNINGTSKEQAALTTKEMMHFLKSLPGGLSGCEAMCLGVAGITNPTLRQLLEGWIREHGYAGPLRMVGDYQIALQGAFSGQPGVLLIAGTGSVCIGQNGDRFAQAGGWGHIIGDEGSGYSIGRDILKAVARDMDGARPTALKALVFEALSIDSRSGVIDFVYRKAQDKKDIARLSVLLEDALNQGDEAARRILCQNALSLAKLASGVIQRLDILGAKVVYSGGVLTSSDQIAAKTTAFLQKMHPSAKIQKPLRDPTDGAIQIARAIVDGGA